MFSFCSFLFSTPFQFCLFFRFHSSFTSEIESPNNILPPPASNEKQHPFSERSRPKRRSIIILLLKNLAHLGRIPQTRKDRQIHLWNPLAEAQRGETISLLGVAHGDGVGCADVIAPHVIKIGAVRRAANHILFVVGQQVERAVSLPPRRLRRHVPCYRGQILDVYARAVLRVEPGGWEGV